MKKYLVLMLLCVLGVTGCQSAEEQPEDVRITEDEQITDDEELSQDQEPENKENAEATDERPEPEVSLEFLWHIRQWKSR